MGFVAGLAVLLTVAFFAFRFGRASRAVDGSRAVWEDGYRAGYEAHERLQGRRQS